MVEMTRQDFVARHSGVQLAGSVWLPNTPARAAVLMYPGSGATDRDNGSYFPPIRSHLLARGFAVGSFDKRGVGESTGRWQDADIIEQVGDVIAVARLVTREGLISRPLGLFGHSQGGWVVLEAGSREPSLSFVVMNSGPGVSPATQMRYSSSRDMAAAGFAPAMVDEMLQHFDMALSLMRDGLSFDRALSRLVLEVGSVPGVGTLRRFLPADSEEWKFASSILDYDPRSAMARIGVPLLALFGGADAVVPVDASVIALRGSVQADLLNVRVFAGADHRIQDRDGASFASGYLDTISAFVETASPESA